MVPDCCNVKKGPLCDMQTARYKHPVCLLLENVASALSGHHFFLCHIQYNLNGSNTDGSFTVNDWNSIFSPYKILPIAQENKYLIIFSYFIMELYVVCTH